MDYDEELQLAIAMSLSTEHAAAEPTTKGEGYWGGKVLQNSIDGLGESGNDGCVSFGGIIRTPSGELPCRALLTTFVDDIEWIAEMFGRDCSVTLVRHFAQGDVPGVFKLTRRLTVVHPKALTETTGCFHAKLMVLVFSDRTRIVVSTANLTRAEWSQIGQAAFVADFLPTFGATASSPSAECHGAFASDLYNFLASVLPVPRMADEWCTTFDSSGTAARIVFSVPGSNPEARSSGMPLLNRTLRECCPGLTSCRSIAAATSSLGSLSNQFLRCIPLNSDGVDVSVLFPSRQTVNNAIAKGFRGEGIIMFSERCFHQRFFPRKVIKDVHWCNEKRAPALSHVKLIAWFSQNGEIGALYIGSHNLTGSAWGFTSSNKTCSIANFELGVIVPHPDDFVFPFVVSESTYTDTELPWLN